MGQPAAWRRDQPHERYLTRHAQLRHFAEVTSLRIEERELEAMSRGLYALWPTVVVAGAGIGAALQLDEVVDADGA